ncbi:MAG: universal stress protein [Anaerolineae bacterium]|nr:universal stress protein [Anaerolineae bacterium]
MANAAAASIAFLALGEVETDPRIARRLPADLAWRLHALPVAEDEGRITVAMADPADEAARDLLLAALGSATCVVQADPAAIDQCLGQIWPTRVQTPVDVAVCNTSEAAAPELWAYARALASLVGGQVRLADDGDETPAEATPSSTCQLTLFHKGRDPGIRQRLARLSTEEGNTPRALLIAEEPRWHIQHILVVLWGEEADDGAIDWAERIALPGHSTVTVLAVVPPLPAMYSGCARMEQGLPALLNSATPLGCRTRRATRRLVQAGIDCNLRLRQGAPDWEVAREVASGDYDLVVVTARPSPWWQRWLEGDLVGTLLRIVGRPLLIAKPAAA